MRNIRSAVLREDGLLSNSTRVLCTIAPHLMTHMTQPRRLPHLQVFREDGLHKLSLRV